MARIQFKGKVQTMRNADDDSAVYEYIQVPEFDRKHCDMNAFRIHKKYGSYANSDLFKGMLNRIRKDVLAGKCLNSTLSRTGCRLIPAVSWRWLPWMFDAQRG
jgi:hypothetical protein